MADRLELRFREALARSVPAGAPVLAAVSGGGDSVALLHLLKRCARASGMRIVVAHLDHGLRRGSRADRRFVELLSRELGLPCMAERREVASLRARGESPEEAARRVRRSFLLRAAQEAGADRIATGHTLDDQAETVLMRLVRGAGAAALTGMAEAGPGPFVRPLLGLERRELRDYLERRGLPYRDDPSNRDLRFDRNRTRRLVLPVLAGALNPRAARHLVKAAALLREDALYLDELASRAFRRLSLPRQEDRIGLDAGKLARSPRPIAKRVARIALQRAGADARRIATRHIEALIDLASGSGDRELHLPGPLLARRRGNEILITPRK